MMSQPYERTEQAASHLLPEFLAIAAHAPDSTCRYGRGAVVSEVRCRKPVPEPALDALPLRGQTWEMARYRAYRSHLAGRTIGETFGRSVRFLTLAGAKAACAADDSVGARR